MIRKMLIGATLLLALAMAAAHASTGWAVAGALVAAAGVAGLLRLLGLALAQREAGVLVRAPRLLHRLLAPRAALVAPLARAVAGKSSLC